MRLSLRWRFILSLLLILVIICGGFAYLLTRQAAQTLQNNIVTQSRSFAALSAKPIGDSFVLYKDSGSVRIEQQIDKFTDLNSDIKGIAIADVGNTVLYKDDGFTKATITNQQAASLEPTYLYNNGRLNTIVQPYIEDFGVHRYNIIYQVSYESVDTAAQNIATNFILYSLLGVGISLGLAYPLLNYLFVRPVAQISKSARVITGGKFDEQINFAHRQDEIGDLANSVNTMAESLEADIEKLKAVDALKSEFLIITSHSLRTPISIIKGYVEQLEDMHPDKEILKVIEPIKASTLRLGVFAEDVLTISSIEAGKSINQEPTRIAPLVQTISEQFESIAHQKGLAFTTLIKGDPVVKINSSYFRTAVWNLLDNAAKFTKSGGSVHLIMEEVGNDLKLIVLDTGIGIEKKEIPRLFTKFHRGTDILQYNFEGMGIGLYLTKIIVEQHGGHISVQSTAGEGSSFTISLPISPN